MGRLERSSLGCILLVDGDASAHGRNRLDAFEPLPVAGAGICHSDQSGTAVSKALPFSPLVSYIGRLLLPAVEKGYQPLPS